MNYVKLIEDIDVLFDTETKVKNAEDEDDAADTKVKAKTISLGAILFF